MAGLEEGYDSESLRILAGHRSEDNPFQLVDYFNRVLRELNLTQPDRKSALFDVLKFHGSKIVHRQFDPYLGFEQIHNIVNKTEFDHSDLELSDCYADYITIWEVANDGLQLHEGSGLSKPQFIDKTKDDLVKHISSWLTKHGST